MCLTMEDEEIDGEFWITQSTCSKRSSDLNVVVEKEIGDDVTIFKEQNVISSPLSRVSDAGLRERIRNRIPKATKDCTSWALRA